MSMNMNEYSYVFCGDLENFINIELGEQLKIPQSSTKSDL